jgi:hypothetical protein
LAAGSWRKTSRWRIGVTKHFVVLRTGVWTIALPRQLEGSFPNIDSVISSADQIIATARLAPTDIALLRQSLGKLRSEEGMGVPVTLDHNGSVTIRCLPAGQPKQLELVLTNSTREGAPVSFTANRTRLLRALELGVDSLHFAGDDTPVLWQAGNCYYAWAPFGKDDTIAAGSDAIRLASPATAPEDAGPRAPSRRRSPTPGCSNGGQHSTAGHPRPVASPTRKRPAANGKPASGVDRLIQQAEAVHESLRQTLLKNRELIQALKQHRRQTRLVRTTLSSLKELQGIGP